MKTRKTNLLLVLCIIVFCIYSCANNNNENSSLVSEIKKDSLVESSASMSNNKGEVEKRVSNFLIWYKQKYDTLASIALVTIPDNDKGYYSINVNNTEEYIKVFSKSGFVTGKFLRTQREYFKNCNEQMQKEKQSNGPPIGLEHDLILLTQDIDNTLSEINKANMHDYNETENAASINVSLLNELKFSLIKENNNWLIDKIELSNVN